MLRIDKFLADQGIGTRTMVKDIVKKGRIKLDGKVVTDAGLKFDPDKSVVYLDDVLVGYAGISYYMMNKPQDVVCANKDNLHDTVFDLMDVPGIKDLFTVGRLDIDTEGILLITNDGEMSHRLLSPKRHVPKTYYLETDEPILKSAVDIVAEGFVVDEELTAAPGKLELIDEHSAYLTISEGKFHQVKRMMHKLGSEVTYLKRVSFAGLELDKDLKLGEYRSLTDEEIKRLKTI